MVLVVPSVKEKDFPLDNVVFPFNVVIPFNDTAPVPVLKVPVDKD